jgi:hypothetical protein
MCKEMPVILVSKVVDPKKKNQKKMEGRGGGEAQGVADPPKNPHQGQAFPVAVGLPVIDADIHPRVGGKKDLKIFIQFRNLFHRSK